MTKAQIDNKRQMIITTCRNQINQMHKILKLFGEIPNAASNGDINILVNDILLRIGSSERDIKVFEMKPDDYIERYNADSYINFVQGKIDFFKSRQEFYAFNASLRQKPNDDFTY
ncbi:MAG TPA: hypothetical protein DD621_03305 [Clostridiales bacterium]|nr:hypothetical protein [Clostridiales bacterium]